MTLLCTSTQRPHGAIHISRSGSRFASRSYRASIDRIEGLTVEVAPIEEQHKAVAQVEQYESEIRKAQAIMDGCAARKNINT